MHRALRLQEIARIVASYVSSYGDWLYLAENYETWREDPLNTQDLLNMALTCRDLCEPALDGLWECMDDLTPLFSLLSNYEPPDSNRESFTIRGLIEDRERTRFDIYANRIRCYRHQKDRDIPVSACAHILREYQRSCVLPRLLFLYIVDDTPTIHFFVSPHLREFHTRSMWLSRPKDGNIVDLLYSISPMSSNLNCLNVAVGLEPKLFTAILRLPRLRTLYLQNTSNNVLHVETEPLCQIASSPTLLKLKIWGCITWAANNTDSSMEGRHIFPSLSYLSLSCRTGDLKPIISYLDRISLPKLETFEIHCTSPFTDDTAISLPAGQWDRFCHALGSLLGSAFRRLEIKLPAMDDIILPPLLKVLPNHTTSFSLFSRCINTFTREDVFAIARALPKLDNLDIPRFPEPHLNFNDLISIARSLPHLKYLTAELDFRTVTTVDDVPLLDHPLKAMTLVTLHCDSSHTAAHALMRAFPHFRGVMFPHHEEEDVQNRLLDLRRLIQFAAAVRADDAKRV